MKTLIKQFALLFILAINTVAFSRYTYKAPLSSEDIPSHITTKFHNNFEEEVDVTWYPYPYQSKQAKENNSRFFALSDKVHTTQYYEAMFQDETDDIKHVFDLDGNLILNITIKDKYNLPDELSMAVIAKGYEFWGVINYEVVEKLEDNSITHKVLILSGAKTRAVYFDENFKFKKELKWEINDMQYKRKKTVFYKSGSHGERKKVEFEQMPIEVKNKIITADYYENAFEYHMVNSIHVPEHKVVKEYYDLYFDPIYEVIYTQDKSTFKTTIDSNGNEVETVEVIQWEKLPKFVKETTSNMKYSFWLFENNIEKVELLDGTNCYRLYAKEFGESYVLSVNMK